MGLADIVRNGVAIADSLTADLQPEVDHYLYSEATLDSYDKVTWGSPHKRKCIVEAKRRLVRNAEGHDVLSSHKLTFPRAVSIDPRDKFVMPDGTTGPLIAVEGMMDAGFSNGTRFLNEVWLG
jgi:hypothetical protein